MSDRWAAPEPARSAAAGAEDGRAAVTIEPARLRDLRAVARVQASSFRPRLAYGLGTLLLLWALPHVRVLVARMPPPPSPSPASPPLGAADPSPRRPPVVGSIIGDRTQGEVRVINLAVEPAARRQGVGRRLLAALEATFPEGDLVLMVEEANAAARALYSETGYRQVGVAQHYYGRGRPGIWMQKRRTVDGRGATSTPPARDSPPGVRRFIRF